MKNNLTIDNIIERLERIRRKYGDIPVSLMFKDPWFGMACVMPVAEINLVGKPDQIDGVLICNCIAIPTETIDTNEDDHNGDNV